jgi:hypothetical protein
MKIWLMDVICFVFGCKAPAIRYSDLILTYWYGLPTERTRHHCQRCGLEWESDCVTSSFDLIIREG